MSTGGGFKTCLPQRHRPRCPYCSCLLDSGIHVQETQKPKGFFAWKGHREYITMKDDELKVFYHGHQFAWVMC